MQANARMDVIDEDMAVIDRRCPALKLLSDLQVVHIPHQSGRWPPPTGCQRPPRWQHITLPNPQVQVSQHCVWCCSARHNTATGRRCQVTNHSRF